MLIQQGICRPLCTVQTKKGEKDPPPSVSTRARTRGPHGCPSLPLQASGPEFSLVTFKSGTSEFFLLDKPICMSEKERLNGGGWVTELLKLLILPKACKTGTLGWLSGFSLHHGLRS